MRTEQQLINELEGAYSFRVAYQLGSSYEAMQDEMRIEEELSERFGYTKRDFGKIWHRSTSR